MISMLTATELMEIAMETGADLNGIDLSWMESDEIKAYEEEDVERRRRGKGKRDSSEVNPTPLESLVQSAQPELRWMPKEMGKVIKNSANPGCLSSGTTKTGIHIIRRVLKNALIHEETICGRLFLMQSEKKKRKSKTGLPSKKTTRPITVSSVIQKILEKILLMRITETVI